MVPGLTLLGGVRKANSNTDRFIGKGGADFHGSSLLLKSVRLSKKDWVDWNHLTFIGNRVRTTAESACHYTTLVQGNKL
jgi:hypothetical protein